MHRRLPAGLVLTAALVVTLVSGPPAGAEELPLSVTDQVLLDGLELRERARALGPDLAGVVIDAETGQEIWRHHRDERQIPASTVKLLTAVTTLESFGPEHRFTTRVMTGETPRRLVLTGGGDPSLSRANLRRLARVTAAHVLASGMRRVRVDVDDSLFPGPTLARGWRSTYPVNEVSPVRALVVDQQRSWDTSLGAGRTFATLLENRGLRVGKVVRAVRPATSTEIAQVQGATVITQVVEMLKESDNDIAEGLHRLVALQNGFAPTWQGASEAQTAVLARLGVALEPGKVHDGSGLSRANRLRPSEVVAVLRTAFDPAHPSLTGLQGGALPIAGVDGTLGRDYLRYVTWPTRCAAGLVEGKTGSLSGVIALSGLARGADGRLKIYSFLLNQVDASLKTRRAVDKLATTITGCW